MSVYTAPVFPFFPNWESPVEETRSWLTDIIVAEDGTETRISLRGAPRRTLAFDMALLEEQELQTLDRLLWARGAEVFAVPLWHDKSLLLASALAADTAVYCDTTDREFEDGGAALLIKDYQTFEVLHIDTVSADHLTLSVGLDDPWTLGEVLVIPLVTGRMAQSWRISRPTASLGAMTAQFEMETKTLPAVVLS